MSDLQPFSNLFLEAIQHASSSYQPITSLIIKNSHVPFILFDSTVSASFPIVLSSSATTKLYGHTTTPKVTGDILGRAVVNIKDFILRTTKGEVRSIEARFNRDSYNDDIYDGKLKLVYLSNSIISNNNVIGELLSAYGTEIHRLSQNREYELLYLNISRILYYC